MHTTRILSITHGLNLWVKDINSWVIGKYPRNTREYINMGKTSEGKYFPTTFSIHGYFTHNIYCGCSYLDDGNSFMGFYKYHENTFEFCHVWSVGKFATKIPFMYYKVSGVYIWLWIISPKITIFFLKILYLLNDNLMYKYNPNINVKMELQSINILRWVNPLFITNNHEIYI